MFKNLKYPKQSKFPKKLNWLKKLFKKEIKNKIIPQVVPNYKTKYLK